MYDVKMSAATRTAATVVLLAFVAQAAIYAHAVKSKGYAFLNVFMAAIVSPVLVFGGLLVGGVPLGTALAAGGVALLPLLVIAIKVGGPTSARQKEEDRVVSAALGLGASKGAKISRPPP